MSIVSPAADPPRAGYRWVLALLLAFAAAKAILVDPIDPDFFWHVRVADQLLADGIGPVPDPFSFMSQPGDWTPFSWLGELLMKWTFDALGLRGIVGVHAFCSVAFFALIALACDEACRAIRGERRPLATLASVGFAMLLSLAYLSFRPVTIALVLMAAMSWLLWRDRRVGGRLVWLLVPATVVLTNLHLYVILFVAALWAMAIGAMLDARTSSGATDERAHLWHPIAIRAKRLFILAVACSLAACCTPMLPGCIRNAVWFNGQDPMVLHKLVAEILPFHAGALGKVLLVIVVATVAFAVRARRLLGFELLLTLAVAVAILFQMGRFSTVFAVLACPILAASQPRLRDAALAHRPLRLVATLASLAIVARFAVGFPSSSTTMDAWLARSDDDLRYPTAAATFVERSVPRVTGKLFNELTWGGYLIWRLGDRYQVFMDGRTLIYPAEFWRTTYVERDAAKLGALLSGEQADAAILPAERSRLAGPLKALGWREAYADERAVVLVPPTASETAAAAD